VQVNTIHTQRSPSQELGKDVFDVMSVNSHASERSQRAF